MKKIFSDIKVALLNAPNLALSEVTKFFHLFVDEKMEEVKWVLMQTLGLWKRLTANLSKKLDPVATGWPSFLHIIAVTALLVKDSDKLTLGKSFKVFDKYTQAWERKDRG